MSDPFKQQVGGDHYTGMAIQPIEYCMANKLDACESAVIRYVSRHRRKNGKEDLLKAKHCIDLLISFEYGTIETGDGTVEQPTGEKSES